MMEGRVEVDAADVDESRAPSSAARSRALPATLLVAALLGFLLPFATVSCGTPVTFTGLELATANVPGHDDAELARDIESNGTVVAAIALVCIAAALGLLVARLGGWGVAAVIGMLALLFLPWICVGSLADFELHEGYLLSVGSLAVLAGVRRIESVERRSAQGRRRWPAVLAGAALVVPIVLTMILAAASDPYA